MSFLGWAIGAFVVGKLLNSTTNENSYDNDSYDDNAENEYESNFVGLRGRNSSTPLPNFSSPNYNPYRDGSLNISLSPRKGYTYFSLVGMYYYLNENNFGKFNGYAVAETNNQYDKYAITIYDESGHKIGHLPKGNKKVHSYIQSQGGQVHAYGYVQIYFNGTFDGAVCVETNVKEVHKRNAPYAPNDEYRMKF